MTRWPTTIKQLKTAMDGWLSPVTSPKQYIETQKQALGIQSLYQQNPQQVLAKLQWQLKHIRNGQMNFGTLQQMMAGEGGEFLEIRDYVPGDDLRKLDWHVFARTQEPHVREWMAEKQLTVWLVLDQTASMGFGRYTSKAEKAVELALCFGTMAIEAGHRLGLYYFDGKQTQHILPLGGKRQLNYIAATLLKNPVTPVSTLLESKLKNKLESKTAPTLDADIKTVTLPKGAEPLNTALNDMGRLIKSQSLVFLFSDFLETSHWQLPLKRFVQKASLYSVCLTDEREKALPEQLPYQQPLQFCDYESGATITCETLPDALKQQYQNIYVQLQQNILDNLKPCNGFQRVSTSLPVEQFFSKTTHWPIGGSHVVLPHTENLAQYRKPAEHSSLDEENDYA